MTIHDAIALSALLEKADTLKSLLMTALSHQPTDEIGLIMVANKAIDEYEKAKNRALGL